MGKDRWMDVSRPIISCHTATYSIGLMDTERENMLSPSFKSAHSHSAIKAFDLWLLSSCIKC